MSNHASDDVLRELALLAALDCVQARADTSAIAEIQDWSGAAVGEFYGAIDKQPFPAAEPSELTGIVSRTVASSTPHSSPYIPFGGMEHAQATDSQLISSLFQDDVPAWREFVRRYQPLIMRTIAKTVGRWGHDSSDLVEDLVQDVFAKLCTNGFEALKTFNLQHEQALAAFLKAVATNVAQDYFRSAASAYRGGGGEHELNKDRVLAEVNTPSSDIDQGVLVNEIDRLLQVFSERDRTVFWLYYRSGLNAKQISQMKDIGLTVKGIESLLLHMTRRMREQLASPTSEGRKGTQS